MPTVVDAGPTATSWSDRVLFGGLVALVVAATMSGLWTDVTIWGREFTIRPDQVVLLALLPAIAVALTRRGLWPLVVGPAPSRVRVSRRQRRGLVRRLRGARREPPGHGAHDRLRRDVHRGRGPHHGPAGVGPAAPRGGRRARLSSTRSTAPRRSCCLQSGIDVGGVMFGQVGPHSVTAKSTFPEANLLAAFMLLLAIFSAVRLVSASGGALTAPHGSRGFCLAGLVLVLTVTRAAWLSLLVGLLLLGLALLIRGKSLRRSSPRCGPCSSGWS